MELTDLRDLYIEELRDLYSAETQILKALPKMISASTAPELKQGFETHLNQTEGQVTRLEQIFINIGERPTGKVCHGMKGVIEEGAEMIKERATPAVKDAALISAAQRVEHYEIAGYGTAANFAKLLNETLAEGLLRQTLAEESETDKKLSQIAQFVVNPSAAKGHLVNAGV